jgi:hypothetical protein
MSIAAGLAEKPLANSWCCRQQPAESRAVFLRIFLSPKRGRSNSPLGDNGIYPWVASDGGTRKPNARADADPQAMRYRRAVP